MTMLKTLENLVAIQNDVVKNTLDRKSKAKQNLENTKKNILDFAMNVNVEEHDLDPLFTLLDHYIEDYANAVKWLAIEERTLERYTERLHKEQTNG